MSDEKAMVVSRPNPGALAPTSLEQAVKLANLMADSQMVPQHLQGKPANCLMVIEQATRWGMSPFAVAQCTSVIKGKLMFEGKLVAAVVNARGELAERLSYTYSGAGMDRKCLVRGRIDGEPEAREVEVVFGQAKTSQACWNDQPDQQLAYYGARVWARRHLPEVMLGVYSPDEKYDEPMSDADAREIVTNAMQKAAPGSPTPVDVTFTDAAEEPPEREPGSDDDEGEPWSPEEPKPGEFRDQVECWKFVGPKGTKAAYGKEPGEWRPIGMEPQRSLEQNKKIHALRNERGYDDAKFRERLVANWNKDTTADLSVREAGELIDAMERATAKHGTAAQKREKQQRRTAEMVNDLTHSLAEKLTGGDE